MNLRLFYCGNKQSNILSTTSNIWKIGGEVLWVEVLGEKRLIWLIFCVVKKCCICSDNIFLII